jgi:hypothetical protein
VLLGAVALSGTLLLTRALTARRDLPTVIGEARVPAPAPREAPAHEGLEHESLHAEDADKPRW